MTRAVVQLDPECGPSLEERGQLEEWEQEWPNAIRVVEVSDEFLARYRAYCIEDDAIRQALAAAFEAASSHNTGSGQ